MRKWLIATAGLALATGACASRDEQVCQRTLECAEEEDLDIEDDSDYVRRCTASAQGSRRVIEANSEAECDGLLAASDAYFDCRLKVEDCQDFLAGAPDDCEDELQDYLDALEDVDDNCNVGLGG